jgi:hypothetical protein
MVLFPIIYDDGLISHKVWFTFPSTLSLVHFPIDFVVGLYYNNLLPLINNFWSKFPILKIKH